MPEGEARLEARTAVDSCRGGEDVIQGEAVIGDTGLHRFEMCTRMQQELVHKVEGSEGNGGRGGGREEGGVYSGQSRLVIKGAGKR